jgi:MYXO-CTERM domain-containing protein
MMRRLGYWLGLTCLLCAPALALAQDPDDDDDTGILPNSTGGLSVRLLFVGGESFNTLQNTPLGKRACDENLELHFRVEGLPTGFNSSRYLEFWKGTSCSGTDRKDAEEGNDCAPIGRLERIESQPYEEPRINMADLCDRDGNVNIWFLPVDSLDTNEAVDVYGRWELMLDLAPPAAPTNVRSGPGETEIPIDWEPSGANISRNYLIWDPTPTQVRDDADGGTGDEECGSPYLMPGEEVDLGNLPLQLRRKRIEGDVDHADVSGDELGARIVAMGVVAVDLAENVSPISNITCVRVVPTDGFWDAIEEENGGFEQGCACSLPGARTSPLAILPVAIALLVLRIRRKRRS